MYTGIKNEYLSFNIILTKSKNEKCLICAESKSNYRNCKILMVLCHLGK